MKREINQLAQADMEALKQVLPIITPQDSTITGVDARSLHDALDIGQMFSHWIKAQIDRLELVENEDFGVIAQNSRNPQGGRPTVAYIVSLEAAKSIAMISQTEKGRVVRKYFIACEKAALAPRELTRLELIELAMDSEVKRLEAEKKVLALEVEVKVAAPKVRVYDTVMDADELFTTTQVAKQLGMTAIALNQHLKRLGWKFKVSDTPTAKAIDNGWLTMKTRVLNRDASDGSGKKAVAQPWFTMKGMLEVIRLLDSVVE